MRRAWALIALGQLLLAALCTGQVANLDTYPINWAAVPTSPAAKNLTANCICNVSPDTCDPNCCCDELCPAGVTAVAALQGQCLPEGPPPQSLDYCVMSSSVARVNLPASSDFYVTTVAPADQQFLNQLLCVVSSQNPNMGETYPDPAPGPAGSNTVLAGCSAQAAAPTGAAQYQLNVPISVRAFDGNGAVKPLVVPFPTWSMECQDNYQPGWLQPLPASQQNVFSQCLRTLVPGLTPPLINVTAAQTVLQSQCTQNPYLRATTYSDLLFLIQPPPSTSTLATVTVLTQYLNTTTGQLKELSAVPAPTYANGTCRNVLQYLNMTFVYSVVQEGDDNSAATMELIEVRMSLVVTDFSYTSLASATVMTQAVRLDFLEVDLNDEVVVQNSGNPGYLSGFPLLAGIIQDYTDPAVGQKQAIRRLTFGFPLPAGDLNGRCSPTGLTPVRYGFNATSSCAVPLNLTQLQTLCESAAQTNPALLLKNVLGSLFSDLTNDLAYIGIWGNSNYTSVAEWVQVVQDDSFKTPVWIGSDRGCSDLVTGFDLNIVTGVAFAANNLQRKVLYVNLCYRVDTWSFPMYQNASLPYNFQMTSTVSFIPLPQTPTASVKPHPPLGVVLPVDIFYPFVTAGAPSGARVGGALAVVLPVLGWLLIACLTW